LVGDDSQDPIDFLSSSASWEDMSMLRHGRMYQLKKIYEDQLNTITLPFFESRDFASTSQDGLIEIGMSKIDPDELCDSIQTSLPTDKEYQLEKLGFYYELMIRLEDAKKCYDLQYECTKEPELLEKSKELDKQIQERNDTRDVIENISDNLTPDHMRKRIESTELNIRKYVVELFSDNFTELFKKNPKLKEESQKIRSKDEDSMLNFNENSAIDTISLGSLGHILKISKGKSRSKYDDKCKECEKSWGKGFDIYFESIPKKISCTDKMCFIKQGGLVKDTPQQLTYRIFSIANARNVLSHPRDYDEEMFKKIMREAYLTCDVVNHFIEQYLKNKQSI